MKKTVLALTILMTATLGWLANDAYVSTFGSESVIEKAKNAAALINGLPEKAYPADRIPEDRIKVFSDKVLLEIPNARWATFTPTHSMAPVFDAGSNAIEIVPQKAEEIQQGDIASYTWADGSTIIHRVIETGTDEQGWYAIMKGDNVPYNDPEKVRFSQIKRVVVAIVY